eukprot:COSAG01_NODE_6679_length_3547_cov_4.002320_2_plen_186_part_00
MAGGGGRPAFGYRSVCPSTPVTPQRLDERECLMQVGCTCLVMSALWATGEPAGPGEGGQLMRPTPPRVCLGGVGSAALPLYLSRPFFRPSLLVAHRRSGARHVVATAGFTLPRAAARSTATSLGPDTPRTVSHDWLRVHWVSAVPQAMRARRTYTGGGGGGGGTASLYPVRHHTVLVVNLGSQSW